MAVYSINEMNEYSVLQEIKVLSPDASTYKIKGSSILQTLDEINGNRRLYTHAIGEIYVDSANQKINRGRLLGEMDHPYIKNPKDPNEVKRQMMVLWERVSHKFDKMWIEGNNICGVLETLSNTRGMDLARIANIDKVPIGFSCRAVGKVKPRSMNGQAIMEVVEPTLFVTYDAVTDPSHKTAEMTDISEVITNANEMSKMRSVVENSNDVALDESNALFELSQIFSISNGSTEPVRALIENFINSPIENSAIYNDALSEAKFVQNNMTALLGEYLSSSDKKTGISKYSTLNESNVHSLMQDYANQHSSKVYSTVKSARSKIEEYLG